MPAKKSTTAVAEKKEVVAAPIKKAIEKKEVKPVEQYSLLAFDEGKVRILGNYVGRSPPQAAKKVLKQHSKLQQIDRKGVTIYLRKAGEDKVSLYVGYREELASPIYGFEVDGIVKKTGQPGKVIVKQKTAVPVDKETGAVILDPATGQPLKHKFLHSHYPRVVRVAVFPAGL
jgi:hypothetical protein